MHITVHKVDITTNSSGAFSQTVTTPHGLLMQLRYVPDGSNPLATGADLTIVDEKGFGIYSHSNIGTAAFNRLPRLFIADAADGSVSASLYDYIAITTDLTVTIAQGGDTDSGTLYLYISH